MPMHERATSPQQRGKLQETPSDAAVEHSLLQSAGRAILWRRLAGWICFPPRPSVQTMICKPHGVSKQFFQAQAQPQDRELAGCFTQASQKTPLLAPAKSTLSCNLKS